MSGMSILRIYARFWAIWLADRDDREQWLPRSKTMRHLLCWRLIKITFDACCDQNNRSPTVLTAFLINAWSGTMAFESVNNTCWVQEQWLPYSKNNSFHASRTMSAVLFERSLPLTAKLVKQKLPLLSKAYVILLLS